MLVFGASQASALPLVPIGPTPGLVLAQSGPSGAEQQAPSADLDEVLRATRAKLDELTEATARVASETERQQQTQALRKDNERLAAELTTTIDAARRESARLDRALATLRGQNEQLDERLTRADAARSAALGKASQTRTEMAKKLKIAADEVEQAKAELVSRREELETTRQKLARADGTREQVEARVTAMEKRVERSSAEAARLRTELADAKEQLEQAATAAVAAERARQAATHEADRLRSEAEGARSELKEARTESARLQIANAELERQIHALHQDLRSATAVARQTLTMMEKRVAELNAAVESARPERAAPADEPQATPDAAGEERDAGMPNAPSAIPQPPAPAASTAAGSGDGAALETGSGALEKLIDSLVTEAKAATETAHQDPVMREAPAGSVSAALDVAGEAVEQKPDAASSATAPSTEPALIGEISAETLAAGGARSTAGPAAPSSVEADLTRFHASLQALNELELSAAGSDLFSAVESADGREVRVSTTAAWDSLPPIGRESYLESLLGYWVEARAGKQGPAVVQIVDSRGQVLLQKSWP